MEEKDFEGIIDRISQQLIRRIDEVKLLGEFQPKKIDIFLDFRDGMKIDGSLTILNEIRERISLKRLIFFPEHSPLAQMQVLLNVEGYKDSDSFPPVRIF